MAGNEGTKRYAVTLERGTDGSYLAWVHELPGCAVRAPSRDEVLERLPGAIEEFVAWTSGGDRAGVEVVVADEVESAIEADEDTEVLLAPDRRPLTAADWDEIARLLRRSRAELLALLERLPDDALERRREGSERTVREEIEHVAFVELMYAAWTFDLRSGRGLAEFLAWTREVAAGRLAELAAEQSDEVTAAEWAGAPRQEPWTARKAGRRLVWHELLHLRALERFAARARGRAS